MTTALTPDPLPNFRFLLELDGITRASFQEVTGFDSSVDVTEHREGGDNSTVRKLPGLIKYSNIQLKWGMVPDDEEFQDWHQSVVRGEIERKNGSIVLLSHSGEEVARWNFVRAWPVKWDGPDLNAEGSDVAVESIELAHEGVERA